MDAERYQLVKRIFREVCDAAPDQRRATLERSCQADAALRAEVESLLAQDERCDGFLRDSPALDHAQLLDVLRDTDVQPPPRPQRIGQYRICDVLGEGGMGVVFLAEQDNPRRPVALKVIRPGVSTPSILKRFEYEAHLLGRLHHPGIAQVYEAGTADAGAGPQPFFAMELVRGEPLTEFAAKHHLSIHERLHLLARICDAVHHAHQKGVIHRDLKPGNILVERVSDDATAVNLGASAQPKILDFGVARAIDPDASNRTLHTSAGELIGTIAYMSPEQLGGDPNDVDIRADVYSIGVICYELLAGRLPHDLRNKRLPERIRIIQEIEIPPLGRLKRALKGDVETIVAKALEKNRARRYQSALELADDLRRFLADQPIAARPPSAMYQFRKFAKRNKVMLIGSSIAAAAAIFAGTSYYLQKAANEERMLTWIEVRDELSDPLRPPVRDLDKVRAVSALADEMESDQPLPVAEMRAALGLNYMKMASYNEANDELVRALELRHSNLTPPHADLAESHTNLARLMWYQGQYLDAISQYTIALDMRRQLLGTEIADENIAGLLDQLATCRRKLGEYEIALELAEEALGARRRLFGENHWLVAASKTNLAMCLNEQERHVEAGALFREALATLGASIDASNDDLRVAAAMTSFADCLIDIDQLNEAEDLAQRGLQIKQRGYPVDHPSTANSLYVLAKLRMRQNQMTEAEPLAREALRMQQATQPATHLDIAATNLLLAEILLDSNRAPLAEPHIRTALAIRAQQLPDQHFMNAEAHIALGRCLVSMSQFADALPLLEAAREVLGAADNPGNRTVTESRRSLQAVYESLGHGHGTAEFRH